MNDRIEYILHLADTTLILSQRNSEWCGHGPILEQDIAITNISLDLIGQSRLFYQYAASLINASAAADAAPATEDTLAYHRNERSFMNLLLTEQPNGDWGQTILRQYFFSQFQQLLFEGLRHSKDEQLAAIAEKSIKETAYHVRWSREWVIRLGDGTEESHERMAHALTALWPYTGEFFMPAAYEAEMAATGIGVDVTTLLSAWQQQVKAVLEEATLTMPANVYMQRGGKTGIHTEHMGLILAEMQYLQRTYPGCEW